MIGVLIFKNLKDKLFFDSLKYKFRAIPTHLLLLAPYSLPTSSSPQTPSPPDLLPFPTLFATPSRARRPGAPPSAPPLPDLPPPLLLRPQRPRAPPAGRTRRTARSLLPHAAGGGAARAARLAGRRHCRPSSLAPLSPRSSSQTKISEGDDGKEVVPGGRGVRAGTGRAAAAPRLG